MKLKTITIICSSIVAIVSVIFCYLITIAVCSYHSDERADLLELRYADLKRDYNFINQSYQDILAVVYDKDPDLIEKLMKYNADWKVLKGYNNNFDFLWFDLGIPTDKNTGEPILPKKQTKQTPIHHNCP